MMKGKLKRSMSKLSMFLTPYENIPLNFESGGYISRKYRGRIVIKLTNYSTNSIKLHSGTTVGYIVMQPFGMEYIVKYTHYKSTSFFSLPVSLEVITGLSPS